MRCVHCHQQTAGPPVFCCDRAEIAHIRAEIRGLLTAFSGALEAEPSMAELELYPLLRATQKQLHALAAPTRQVA